MSSFSAQTLAAIEYAAELFRQSKYAVALTGAGFSMPSGIPDFRLTGSGLWAKNEAMEVASLTSFQTAPEKFFNWFRPLASQIFNAIPNAAHEALAQLECQGPLKSVITQNVDVLHQKAGQAPSSKCTERCELYPAPGVIIKQKRFHFCTHLLKPAKFRAAPNASGL